MPKVSEMKESKFLKQSDVGAGLLVTISSVKKHNVAKEGADEEYKWCLEFAESDKPLVLNATNIQLCERIFGSDDTDDWEEKKLVLYTDPTISYGGKITGGIRVRAPKNQGVKAAVKAAIAPVAELSDEDIPF